jgi:hypothetical protein
MTTLFAVTNGDQVRVSFSMLYGYNPFLSFMSRVYLYTFSIFFIVVILNFFFNIIGDAFEQAKEVLEASLLESEKRKKNRSKRREPEEKIENLDDELLKLIHEQDENEITLEEALEETRAIQLDRIRRSVNDVVFTLPVTEWTKTMAATFNEKVEELINLSSIQV